MLDRKKILYTVLLIFPLCSTIKKVSFATLSCLTPCPSEKAGVIFESILKCDRNCFFRVSDFSLYFHNPLFNFSIQNVWGYSLAAFRHSLLVYFILLNGLLPSDFAPAIA